MEFFEILDNISSNKWKQDHPHDDEVIVQMTYDDNDEIRTDSEMDGMRIPRRSSAIGATI
jgi:hypothetical protein